MILLLKLSLFVLCVGLISCGSSPSMTDKGKISNVESVRNFTKVDSAQFLRNDCVRGQAEPIILKKDYPNAHFLLQADSTTAVEKLDFENGDKLILHNWGCEYYVLTFQFETSRFIGDTANLEYWYKSAGLLMNELAGSLDAPMDIKRGILFFEEYRFSDEVNQFKNLKLGEEITFAGEEIRSFVTLDRVNMINENRFRVTISFATGPL